MIIDQSRISHSNKSDIISKEKLTNYETIFDHNATEKELGYITRAKNKKEYLKMINYNLDRCYLDLYNLYVDKEDRVKANEYYSMMSEQGRKEDKEKLDEIMSLIIP